MTGPPARFWIPAAPNPNPCAPAAVPSRTRPSRAAAHRPSPQHAATAHHPQGLGITSRGRQCGLLQATQQQNWAEGWAWAWEALQGGQQPPARSGGHALRGAGDTPGPAPVMPVPGAHTPRFQLRYRVPQAQLSLAHAGEARGEDMALAREDGPHGPHPLVGRKPLLGAGENRERRHPLPALGVLEGGPSSLLASVGGTKRGLKVPGLGSGGP